MDYVNQFQYESAVKEHKKSAVAKVEKTSGEVAIPYNLLEAERELVCKCIIHFICDVNHSRERGKALDDLLTIFERREYGN